jgi:hypothetical protein
VYLTLSLVSVFSKWNFKISSCFAVWRKIAIKLLLSGVWPLIEIYWRN